MTTVPTLFDEMRDRVPQPPPAASLELPVEQLMRRARPLPAHEDLVIDDLTDEEGALFLAALAE